MQDNCKAPPFECGDKEGRRAGGGGYAGMGQQGVQDGVGGRRPEGGDWALEGAGWRKGKQKEPWKGRQKKWKAERRVKDGSVKRRSTTGGRQGRN